ARRYLPLFADATVADGVAFDTDRLPVEAIWQHTANPGVRVHARGSFGEDEVELQVDITGGPPPRPDPVLGDLPTACGQTARGGMARPERVVGQTFQALFHPGMPGWRPKDLEDLGLLIDRLPMDRAALREAVVALFAELGAGGAEARALFASSWWGMKISSAR